MAGYSASNETNTSQEVAQTYSYGGLTLNLAPKTTAAPAPSVNWWLVGGIGAVALGVLYLALRRK